MNIISTLNHQSIMKFIGYSPIDFRGKARPTIITELLLDLSLKDVIYYERKSCGIHGWDNSKKLINIYGIAAGMAYLHSHNIIHRDLKPDNILIDKHLFPKICDFGLSKILSNTSNENNSIGRYMKGTFAYMAPEVFKGIYTKACDVYSFAVIAYEIIVNEEIYKDMTPGQVSYRVSKGERPTFKYDIPNCYRKLIEDCWSQKPEERPTFDEIVKNLKENPDFNTEFVDYNEFQDYVEELQNIQEKKSQ